MMKTYKTSHGIAKGLKAVLVKEGFKVATSNKWRYTAGAIVEHQYKTVSVEVKDKKIQHDILSVLIDAGFDARQTKLLFIR
jgi:hypothetical protein